MQTVTPTLAGAWEDLAHRCAAPPFLHPGWIQAWQRAFGAEALQAATLRRDGRLAAILPLRASGRVLRSPANAHSPVFGVLAEDDRTAGELLAGLLRRRPHRVDLQHVDREATGVWREAAATAGYSVRAVPQIHSPCLNVSGDWESFQRRLRPGRRSELRRRRRRLEEQGEVRVETVRGGAGLATALAEGFSLEAAGWKGERGSAILSSPATRRFYSEVAAWAEDQGWLRLTFLRVGQRAVAFDYNLQAGGHLYKLKTGYDPAYRAYGPGMLLTYEIIRAAFAGDVHTYELLGGREPWKLELSDGIRPRVRLQLFAPSLVGRQRVTYVSGRVVRRGVRALASRARELGPGNPASS